MSLSFFLGTSKAQISPLTGAINDFTKEVYLDLAANFQRNAIISPLSLHMALGLTLFGSKGETSYAIMQGIQIKNPDTLLNDYKGIIEHLSKSPELKIANKIYFGQDVQLDPSYETGALQHFNSALGKVDLNHSQSAADQINNWVAHQTNNKINNVIGSSNITSDTRLILINAIHFKGIWANPFKRSNTKDKLFYLSETHSIRVPMMYIKEEFIMNVEVGDEGFAMLELPYGPLGQTPRCEVLGRNGNS
uniref:Antichymotrypsin-2 n=1 Tax=Cacopsylla melanoneura TaxID=428564 RepID=A0A8D8MAK2_9HEMI